MKARRVFKSQTAAAAISMALAAALLVSGCIIPKAMIGKLYDEAAPHIEAAKEMMLREDASGAYAETRIVGSLIEDAKNGLMLFYDHNKVSELTGAASNAIDIAKTADASQFLESIGEIETVFDLLIHLNDISFPNIM